MESLLRYSILYSSEAMIHMKEFDYRALEKIEESVLKKVVGTTRSCSRHLLYLELGMIPARFQIQPQVLNFLQYLLKQPEKSILYKVFEALKNHPIKNDWLNCAKETLKQFEIYLTIKEIQEMKCTHFKSLVKKQATKAAFKYLQQKQENGKKGKTIVYEQIQMADYLLPECTLSVSDKIDMFAFRCEMNDLPDNFGQSKMHELQCHTLMDNEHLLNCSHLKQG